MKFLDVNIGIQIAIFAVLFIVPVLLAFYGMGKLGKGSYKKDVTARWPKWLNGLLIVVAICSPILFVIVRLYS